MSDTTTTTDVAQAITAAAQQARRDQRSAADDMYFAEGGYIDQLAYGLTAIISGEIAAALEWIADELGYTGPSGSLVPPRQADHLDLRGLLINAFRERQP